VIRNNTAVQVGDYYHMLLKFLDQAPVAITALDKIIAQQADSNDYQSLEIIIMYLEDIGSIKFSHDFDDIIKAGSKRGHKEFASECATKIIDDFGKFFDRISATRKTEENANLTITLKDYLNLLEEGETSRKLQILAVDDAPVILKTILSVLGDIYKVHIMPDPTRVEKFLMQITPDMIILDYQMPVLSGFDLIPIIRKFEEHKDTPILFLTSEGTTDHVSKALALGACDFMVKPFQANNLIEKVAKHIVRKKLQ
jgi:PleD family two-component response regulator